MNPHDSSDDFIFNVGLAIVVVGFIGMLIAIGIDNRNNQLSEKPTFSGTIVRLIVLDDTGYVKVSTKDGTVAYAALPSIYAGLSLEDTCEFWIRPSTQKIERAACHYTEVTPLP